ncbi:hypothetical protein OG873_23085 [Streptomyces violaceus]|uniref:Uncharacterized protein n=1 Tax=Streptomyces violaceus TaxID=1936 RepID=A0ABZ1NWX0_STRVL
MPLFFSGDETADVGQATGTPVAPDYESLGRAFTGDIHWAQIDTRADEADHFIEPGERIRIAVERQ